MSRSQRPSFARRALMLDAARTMDRMASYHRMLPWLAEWGYNVLHFHITDDQGCRLVFPSLPGLASEHAFSVDEMRAFLEAARTVGIEVIPEIETFGHTRFITDTGAFAHLGGPPTANFNALDPGEPESREVVAKLIADTAQIFASEVIHVGLDEVNLRALPALRDAGEDTLQSVFEEHMAWVHETVRQAGKRPAMWSDRLLGMPELLPRLGRDVLILDWHYDPGVAGDSLQVLAEGGLEVWGAPASVCWKTRLLPNRENLANLRRFTGEALAAPGATIPGMVNTVWYPGRCLPGALDWSVALGGHLFSNAREDPLFCQAFCRDFYSLGREDAANCARCVNALHDLAPTHVLADLLLSGEHSTHAIPEQQASLAGAYGRTLHPRERTLRFTREEARLAAEMESTAAGLAQALSGLTHRAGRNAARLEDLALTASLIERIGHFGARDRRTPARGGAELLTRGLAQWSRDRLTPWDAHPEFVLQRLHRAGLLGRTAAPEDATSSAGFQDAQSTV